MKIGVSGIILKGSLDEALQLCVDAGYEALELVFAEGHDPDVLLDEASIREVGSRCREAGVAISSIMARYSERGGFLTTDVTQRAAARRSLSRALEIAAILGVDAVLLHPGQMDASASYLQVYAAFVDEMRAMAPEAESRGVTIGVENVWNKFMLSPKEACEIIDAVSSPRVGIYLDTANMMSYGFPEQWILDLGKRICRVHFKDFRRREHQFVPLMEGDTPWATVVKALRAVGYDGYVVHEVSGDRETQMEMARRMRSILAMK